MPQNRQEAGSGRADHLKATRFRKGQSGNPGGRPKGLFGAILAATRDGAELIEIALELARGKRVNGSVRMRAIEYLTDRGWGKAVQMVGLVTPEQQHAFARHIGETIQAHFGPLTKANPEAAAALAAFLAQMEQLENAPEGGAHYEDAD